MDDQPAPTGETERERLNRNFSELLQEVRVAVAGVQILFAFLLTLPFAARSADLLGRHKVPYGISVLATAIATVMMLAPVSYHRLVFREGRKPELVRAANLLAQGGLASFAVALVSACFLIADVVFGFWWGIGFASFVAILVAVTWYALPSTSRWLDRPYRQE